MRFASFLITFLVTLVLATLDGKSYKLPGDPLASVCSPLCNEDAALEAYCKSLLDCSDLEMNSDLFLACWAPCLDLAEDCFSLCADVFDDVIQKCYNQCRPTQEPVNCIAVCFNDSFLELKRGLVVKTETVTSVHSTKLVSPQTTKNLPASSPPPSIFTSNYSFSTTPPDSTRASDQLQNESKSYQNNGTLASNPHSIPIKEGRSNTNRSIKIDTLFYKTTSSPDRSDANNLIKIDKLFHDTTTSEDGSDTIFPKKYKKLKTFLLHLVLEIVRKRWPSPKIFSESTNSKKFLKSISLLLRDGTVDIQLPGEVRFTTPSISMKNTTMFLETVLKLNSYRRRRQIQ